MTDTDTDTDIETVAASGVRLDQARRAALAEAVHGSNTNRLDPEAPRNALADALSEVQNRVASLRARREEINDEIRDLLVNEDIFAKGLAAMDRAMARHGDGDPSGDD